MKGRFGKCRAYFTVEASIVIPIMLGSFGFICVLIIYMYERCIVDENTCRALVWKSYIEGVGNRNPVNEEIEAEKVVPYLLACLQEEEENRYLLGGTLSADMVLKGNVLELHRELDYPYRKRLAYEEELSCYFINPVETLRLIKLMEKQQEEGDDNE